MLGAILAGAALGLSLAAPPGPMNALIARQASLGGTAAGIKIGIAAPIADALYLAIWVLGAGSFVVRWIPWPLLAIVGGCLMAFFAWQAWQAKEPEAAKHGFAKAFLVALTNPYQIGWWITAGSVFVATQPGIASASFLVAIFSWVAIFSFLIAHGAKRWTWFKEGVRIGSTIMLAIAAVAFIVVGIGRLL